VTTKKELAKFIDQILGWWLDYLEFVEEKGLTNDFLIWKAKKDGNVK